MAINLVAIQCRTHQVLRRRFTEQSHLHRECTLSSPSTARLAAVNVFLLLSVFVCLLEWLFRMPPLEAMTSSVFHLLCWHLPSSLEKTTGKRHTRQCRVVPGMTSYTYRLELRAQCLLGQLGLSTAAPLEVPKGHIGQYEGEFTFKLGAQLCKQMQQVQTSTGSNFIVKCPCRSRGRLWPQEGDALGSVMSQP